MPTAILRSMFNLVRFLRARARFHVEEGIGVWIPDPDPKPKRARNRPQPRLATSIMYKALSKPLLVLFIQCILLILPTLLEASHVRPFAHQNWMWGLIAGAEKDNYSVIRVDHSQANYFRNGNLVFVLTVDMGQGSGLGQGWGLGQG